MNKVQEDACNLPKTVFSIRDLYPFLETVYNSAPGKILIYLILIRTLIRIIDQKPVFISKLYHFIFLDEPAAFQMSSSSVGRRALQETLLRRKRMIEVLFPISFWIITYKTEYLWFM